MKNFDKTKLHSYDVVWAGLALTAQLVLIKFYLINFVSLFLLSASPSLLFSSPYSTVFCVRFEHTTQQQILLVTLARRCYEAIERKHRFSTVSIAGLLLLTKFCDKPTILSVYNAIGSTFLHRLLLTGITLTCSSPSPSLLLLPGFPSLPFLMKCSLKSPLFWSFCPTNLICLSLSSALNLYFWLLLLTKMELQLSIAQEVWVFWQMPALPDGSHVMELAMKLVQFIISKLPAEKVYSDHSVDISKMVSTIAKQFARLHSALKFEALHLLSALLSSTYSGSLSPALLSLMSDDWSANIRAGVMDVLQNRVGPAEKIHALVLAHHAISIVGEEWLIAPNLPGGHGSLPADRCLLLVLESSRVELAVLLNELAYLKYETPKHSTPNSEIFLETLRNLGVAFALVERIIKLISKFSEKEESKSDQIIYDITLIKMIGGLNETVGVVLDYLQDAKDHGDRKGTDLLASVRVVGRCMYGNLTMPCLLKTRDLQKKLFTTTTKLVIASDI